MRVLFLTHRLPYAPNRGDRIRAYHILKSVSAYADVDLVSLTHDRLEEGHAGAVPFAASVRTVPVPRLMNAARSLAVLPTRRTLTHTFLNAPRVRPALESLVNARPPDVVLAYCSGMAKFALERPLARFPVVLDMVDVDSAKWAALADASHWPLRQIYRREARCLARFEEYAVGIARATLVVNERERNALASRTGPETIQVIPNGVDVTTFTRPADDAARDCAVVFTGVMDYAPNEQAAIWLATQVWPEIRRRRPDARLLLVGSNPSGRLRRVTAGDRAIQLTGTVADVRPYLWQAAVAAAPLHVSRGVQNKVLEAVAAGLPCVITPGVRAGLPDEVLPACAVADAPHAFAERVLELLDLSPEARHAIVRSADLEGLRWESRLAPLQKILETAASQQQ